MDLTETTGETLRGVFITLANLFAWVAHTEQIWFPAAGAYVRYLEPTYQALPDLRGPFLALTLLYIGLRVGDLLDKRDEVLE
jgi:hypothetical protein